MDEFWIEEFLYRGRPKGDERPPAYHVVLGHKMIDGFNRPHLSLSDPMTPEQAEAMGYSLPTLLESINKDLMVEIESLKTAHADKDKAITELHTQIGLLTHERDCAVKDHASAALAHKQLMDTIDTVENIASNPVALKKASCIKKAFSVEGK